MKQWTASRYLVGWILTVLFAIEAPASAENPRAIIETNFGDITIELYTERAPDTVENFRQYAREGFYSGTIFHRVQRNVIIQGGGFTPGLQLKKTRPPIRNEAQGSLRNERGTIAMARSGGAHSANSQFFINLVNNPSFNHKGLSASEFGYAVFGRVVGGGDVVTAIGKLKTGERSGMRDVPKVSVVIKTVRLVEPPGPAAEDILFVVLGKMSLYTQTPDGALSLRNHHFVAELMPKKGGTILGGTLSRKDDPSDAYAFESEGEAFLAHGGRFDDPDELHEAHPDGEYVFSYETKGGRMDSQVLELVRRPGIDGALEAARITLSQAGRPTSPDAIDPANDLEVRWTRAQVMSAQPGGLVDDLIFVLAFDCFGERIAHSGRPFQGGTFLTYQDDRFVVPAAALSSGLRYSLIVEQATADTSMHQGVPGIATYATLTFLDFETSGSPVQSCPPGPP